MNIDYIAGLFDGEGTVCYDRCKKRWVVTIDNSNREVLEKVREYTSMGYICSYRRNEKVYYKWMVKRKNDVIRFLEMIKDRSHIKKQRIEEALKKLNYTNVSVDPVAQL